MASGGGENPYEGMPVLERMDIVVVGPQPEPWHLQPSQNQYVKLFVKHRDSQPNYTLYVAAKKDLPLWKLMNTFCARKGVPCGTLRFAFNGIEITPNHTPQELGMQENDTIDAYDLEAVAADVGCAAAQ